MTRQTSTRIAWDYGDDGFFGLWRLGDAQPLATVHRLDTESERWLALVVDGSPNGGGASVRRTPGAACRWAEDAYVRAHPDERKAIADACADRIGIHNWPTLVPKAAAPVTTKTPNK